MKFETLPLFDNQFKKLAKKYNLIKNDIESFVNDFDSLHLQAISIKKNIYIKSDSQTQTKTKVNEQDIEFTTM